MQDSWHVRAYVRTYVHLLYAMHVAEHWTRSLHLNVHTHYENTGPQAHVTVHKILWFWGSDIWNMSYVGPLDSCSCTPHVHVYIDNYLITGASYNQVSIALPATQYTCSTLHTAFEYNHRLWPVLTDVPCKDHHAHCSVVLDWWRSTGIHFDSCRLSFVRTGFNPLITCGGSSPTAVHT